LLLRVFICYCNCLYHFVSEDPEKEEEWGWRLCVCVCVCLLGWSSAGGCGWVRGCCDAVLGTY
jgi:hypothetical protein